MDGHRARPLVQSLYEQFLVDQDTTAFVSKVAERYACAGLERVAAHGDRLARRAAVYALGYIGDYDSNPVLGRALVDADRGVRCLAENAIRAVWCRAGSERDQKRLAAIIRMNLTNRHEDAVLAATELVTSAAWFAEAWNQRAIAHFCLGEFKESIRDCRQALEVNPYHFGAAAGMGQCYLQLGDKQSALEAFRRALALYPHLEGIRANVAMIERSLRGRNAS